MSSGAELKIVVVGGDEAEQNILKGKTPDPGQPAQQSQTTSSGRAQEVREPEATSYVKPAGESPQQQPTGRQRDESGRFVRASETAKVASSDIPVGPEKAVIDSLEKLSRTIERLIEKETDNKSRNQPVAPGVPAQSNENRSSLQRFTDAIAERWNRNALSKTRAGRAISRVAGIGRRVGRKAVEAIGRTKTGRRAITAIRTGMSKAAGRISKTRVGQAIAARVGAGAAVSGAASSAAGASAGGAASLAPIAAVAAPVVAVGLAAAGAALTVKAMTDAVSNAAKELEELSPAVAMVKAQMQITRELQQFDRAGRIGAGAAQLEAARGRINESMYEVQTKILELILKFAPLLEGVLDATNAGVRGIDLVVAVLNVIQSRIDDFTTDPTGANNAAADQAFEKSLKGFTDALKQVFQTDDVPDRGMDPWIAQMFRIQAPRGGRAAPNPPDIPGNFP